MPNSFLYLVIKVTFGDYFVREKMYLNGVYDFQWVTTGHHLVEKKIMKIIFIFQRGK